MNGRQTLARICSTVEFRSSLSLRNHIGPNGGLTQLSGQGVARSHSAHPGRARAADAPLPPKTAARLDAYYVVGRLIDYLAKSLPVDFKQRRSQPLGCFQLPAWVFHSALIRASLASTRHEVCAIGVSSSAVSLTAPGYRVRSRTLASSLRPRLTRLAQSRRYFHVNSLRSMEPISISSVLL